MVEQKSKIFEEVENIHRGIEVLKTLEQQSPKNIAILEYKSWIKKINEYSNKARELAESVHFCRLDSSLKPSFSGIEVLVDFLPYKFLMCRVVYGKTFLSEPFSHHGLKWRMKVYMSRLEEIDYLAAYIELLDGNTEPVEFNFKFELVKIQLTAKDQLRNNWKKHK